MQGVHYVIEKLGQALAAAENEIVALRQELAKHHADHAEAEMPAPPAE